MMRLAVDLVTVGLCLFAERNICQVLAGDVSESLSLLGRVDTGETDLALLLAGVQYRDGIAVRDGYENLDRLTSAIMPSTDAGVAYTQPVRYLFG